MKRWLCLIAAWVSTFAVFAREQSVRDVQITVTLIRNGTAVIHERWDVNTGDEITEWYLPRENLGDMEIRDFSVYSDNEKLLDDGEWDVDRSRKQKAGKYGIVHKDGGVELCWGIGEYGDHVFEPVYSMTRAVKTLNDYDIFHVQLISDELAAPPQHVKVRIRLAGEGDAFVQLDTANTRVWGFGFHGTAAYEDGDVVFESTEPFGYYSSVIALLRFEKGLFHSPSVQDKDFQEVLDRAMVGADFGPHGEEENNPMDDVMATFFTMLTLLLVGWRIWKKGFARTSRRDRKKVLGVRESQIEWHRDIPFDGDLMAAEYTLKRLDAGRSGNALASAEILRLIYRGFLDIRKDADGRVEISFGKGDGQTMEYAADKLWQMMKEAAGEDMILQEKEFRSWARNHPVTLTTWSDTVEARGRGILKEKSWLDNACNFTPAGQQQARDLLGLKKFLQDFTLTGEREAAEVHLWQEYLVFGSLLGVAKKVAEQLKEIDPSLFEKVVGYDYTTFSGALDTLNSLSRAITYNNYTSTSSSGGGGGGSWGGFGGGTSFGGGGGFSGGGHGGGGR